MEELLLYEMKRLNRSQIEMVRKEEVVPDFKTGRRQVSQNVYLLDSVFEVTNAWLTRTLSRTDVDINTKGWLIDPKDLPDGYEPSENDTVQDYGRFSRVNESKIKGVYLVKTVEEVQGGILIIGQRVAGASQNAILSQMAFDNAEFSGGAS